MTAQITEEKRKEKWSPPEHFYATMEYNRDSEFNVGKCNQPQYKKA